MAHLSLQKVFTSSKVGSMRYAELAFLVLLVAYHAVLLVPRYRRPFPANYLVFVAGMALAWNLGLEGLRWQTLAPIALLLVDLLVLFPTFRRLRGTAPRKGFLPWLGGTLRFLVASVAFLVAVACVVLAVAFPLPQVDLTGGLSVGYRQVRFAPQGDRAGLELRLWYPASGDTKVKPRPQSDPGYWSRVHDAGGPPAYWQSHQAFLPSTLIEGGRPASPGTRYPVVYVALPSGQSADDFGYLFEDLASRGFVVASGGPLSPAAKVNPFSWDQVVDDLRSPWLAPRLWMEPERTWASPQSVDFGWLAATREALGQLEAEPGDPLFEALDFSKAGLWAWGTGPLPPSLPLRAVVRAGAEPSARPASVPELRLVEGDLGEPGANRWYLSAPRLGRADLADSAYLKPYLAWVGLKAQADAGGHGAIRQYQAAFYQAAFAAKGTLKFAEMVPALPSLTLTGR